VYVVQRARADSRRSGVGLAPRPQALPMPAAALVLYICYTCFSRHIRPVCEYPRSALLGVSSALFLGVSCVIPRPEEHLAELLLLARTLPPPPHFPPISPFWLALAVVLRRRATVLIGAAHGPSEVTNTTTRGLGKKRFIFGGLFYGFVGSELAFLTSPRRGLSQKVAVLILCTFKCSTPAVVQILPI
jgi:hypothetical protein